MTIRVLFVTKAITPMLYRVNIGWLAEAIDRSLLQVDSISCTEQDITSIVTEYDVIIYYRMLGLENTGIDRARNLGIYTGYLVDDYLLDFAYGPGIRMFMENVDFVLTPTHILAELYQAANVGKPFFLKHSGLPVARLLQLRTNQQSRWDGTFKVGWLGGASHELYCDLYEAMLKVLSGYGMPIEFICFGKPEEFLKRVQDLPNIRVKNLPFIPPDDETGYYSTIVNLELNVVVNILPCTRLSRGKAALKYAETGLYRIPLITANCGIYREVIREGENGLLAETPEEFAHQVHILQQNPGWQAWIGQNAFLDVVSNYDVQISAREFVSWLHRLGLN